MNYFVRIIMAFFGKGQTVDVEVEKIVQGPIEKVEIPVQCSCAKDLQELVSNEADLRRSITSLEKKEKTAKENLANAELQHKISVEDIQHMHKILDDETALKTERMVFDAEKAAEKEIVAIRKIYAEKLEKELTEERKKMQEFMSKVMAALPNVNVQMGRDGIKED